MFLKTSRIEEDMLREREDNEIQKVESQRERDRDRQTEGEIESVKERKYWE